MRLAQINGSLLDETSSSGRIEAALDAYSRTCAEVTGITPDAGFDAWEEDAFLDSGVAINPRSAAHCVTDYRRTCVFVRAMHAALTRLLSTRPDGVVRILYAGCGPWATLLLPVLGDFPPERLRAQLIDVHPSALDAVRRLVEHFGLQDYAIELKEADASHYRCEDAPDLIVAETMHKALEEEPQFAVTANLAPQLAPGGIFMPQQIDLELCFSHDDTRVTLGRVLSLSAAAHRVPEPVCLQVPVDVDGGDWRIDLMTSIRVFEEHRLLPGDAHITLPRACAGLLPLEKGARLRVEYRCGTFPVFEIEREAI